MTISEYTVRDYYKDVELHAHIIVDFVNRYIDEIVDDGRLADCGIIVMQDQVDYRAQLLSEKFLYNEDTIKTDLHRTLRKMRM